MALSSDHECTEGVSVFQFYFCITLWYVSLLCSIYLISLVSNIHANGRKDLWKQQSNNKTCNHSSSSRTLCKAGNHFLSGSHFLPRKLFQRWHCGRSLTFKWDGCIGRASLLPLPQTEQSWREKRVVDKVLHVVPFTFLLGLGAHLVSHILPI